MTVTLWEINRIHPYARNARKIPQAAIDKVAASIHEFGWRQPIVVDKDGVIIAGHVRLLAAQKLGLLKVPVHVAANLTAAQVRAYRLLDNRSHEEASWDEGLLGLELLDLKDMGFDLNLTGFGAQEIDQLLSDVDAHLGLTNPDEVPEVRGPAVTASGDVWILGDHRVLCGDSARAETLSGVMENQMADLVFCDPPFNVNYQGGAYSRGRARIANDDLGTAFEQFLLEVCRNMLASSKGAVYICMSSSEIDTLKKAFVEAGGHWSTFVIWVKNTFTLGRSDYQRQYEVLLYGWKKGAGHYWCGARDQGDAWFVNKPAVNDLHPTQKPVELVERALLNSSKRRDLVLDPFGGSGSTLIACEKTGRRARVVELEASYVDTIVMRWQNFTGREAVLSGDGRRYREVAECRKLAPTGAPA